MSGFFVPLLVAVCVSALIFVVATPYFDQSLLRQRMDLLGKTKSSRVSDRYGRAGAFGVKNSVKIQEVGERTKNIINKLNLRKFFYNEKISLSLVRAGYRDPKSEDFLFVAKFISVIAMAFLGFLYAVSKDYSFNTVLLFIIGAIFAGLKVPDLYIKNIADKRQKEFRNAFPDSIDLMLICIEAGMSIEMALRRVSEEFGDISVVLAEEMALTTAELTFLDDRKQAYENLAMRTDLDSVRSVVSALVQAEKFGTSLAQAFRILSQDGRDQRMALAERKAASIPPKLTVPMIICFLPPLFCVIIGPAIISTMSGGGI